ncbi:hypothetical protein [Sulfurimonas sp. C5]|uniref:hypothetical protein n=1 Tax=Sulfurimonas sp. C5 TaxID=3036947 RepID=UPI0024588DDB|nr:hypothetical protein [Sulfurimonas sp. C5]MDH4944942.1 hypothetical protein [Sulfurimonas sp. C5]
MEFKNNPFESGHIKNYILLYVSVVVIMILFFIAGELFIEPKEIEKKVFEVQEKTSEVKTQDSKEKEEFKPRFKLLEQPF